MHVYIKSGLDYWFSNNNLSKKKSCTIFEMGFGTGLNTMLALEYAELNKSQILYNTLEAFPLSEEKVFDLNMRSSFDTKEYKGFLQEIHSCIWEEVHKVSPYFSLSKKQKLLSEFLHVENYDVIFYDAFGPRVQPELWTEETLKPLVDALAPQGVFVTYSAKGSVRRALETLGLKVDKIQGPPGKREMIRGICL